VIGRLFNRVNDWDLTWVGFRTLRPAKDQDMRPRVVLLLTLFYGPLAAALAVLIALLVVGRAASPRVLGGMGLGAAVGFLLLQSLAAHFWNRRARALRGETVPRHRKRP
jgi:MFS family permease